MKGDTSAIRPEVDARARQSLGISDSAIYGMVVRVLDERRIAGGKLVDVGCGAGNLWTFVRDRFEAYVGVDALRYDGFPADAEFCGVDLDAGGVPLADNSAHVVTALEAIEHVENPRALLRELVRLARPGGWILVTTPNQLSLLSLTCLVVKKRFSAFQEVHYPAHLTALLEVDLRRIASECRLTELDIVYSYRGRIPLTAGYYPERLARAFPRALSDNVLLVGRKQNG